MSRSTDATAAAETTVLVVEDEADLGELYGIWLADTYDVLVATDGESALEEMTEEVDVVLLDRRMPGMSGDQVLKTIRDQGYRCPAVMVTAIEPDLDIIHLPLDDYVTKPLTKTTIHDVVTRMLRVARAGGAVRRYHSLERRRDILRTAKRRDQIVDTAAFEELTKRLEAAAREAGPGLAWLKQEYYDTTTHR